MPTAPKVTYESTMVSTTTTWPNEFSTTSHRPVMEPVIHSGNRKERRKELSSKRTKRRSMDDNTKQTRIYNPFYGY